MIHSYCDQLTSLNESKSHSDYCNVSDGLYVCTHIFLGAFDVNFVAAGLLVSWSPGARGPEFNELWLRASVSNESWQWPLNRVTHITTKLTWLSLSGETSQEKEGEGGLCALWPKPSYTKCHFCLRLTHNTTTGVFVLEIYTSIVWSPRG